LINSKRISLKSPTCSTEAIRAWEDYPPSGFDLQITQRARRTAGANPLLRQEDDQSLANAQLHKHGTRLVGNYFTLASLASAGNVIQVDGMSQREKIPSLRDVRLVLLSCYLFGLPHASKACIWDGQTLKTERGRAPKMAEVILETRNTSTDSQKLRERLTQLKSTPHENDPDWWNDLAGTHIRLGEINAAISILEPLTNRFAGNYGIHANLGTAYHLQDRYAEAEREIARDLEINPDAHFGLERYHLALLQYLVRDADYQKAHLYIDEWSSIFAQREGKFALGDPPPGIIESDRNTPLSESGWKDLPWDRNLGDRPPPYRYHWNLATDAKFDEGVIYMASLNPKQPACWVMLGAACLCKRNYNLAGKAYEKAIVLKSPQSDLLRAAVPEIRVFVERSITTRRGMSVLPFIGLAVLFALIVAAFWIIRKIVAFCFQERGPS
jgi:hypothetical protein